MRPVPLPVRPGQESVWDFPRPARFEPTTRMIRVVFDGTVLAETTRAIRAIETSHPPSYYIPPSDIRMDLLERTARTSTCEWKGQATYFDVRSGQRRAANAGWAYLAPTPDFKAIAGHVAFYAAQMEACFVDGERVVPQEGSFYGGWITSHVAGTFKGPPGTMGW
jgi:uncharacterized protein (DUF427 family)